MVVAYSWNRVSQPLNELYPTLMPHWGASMLGSGSCGMGAVTTGEL